MKKSILIGFALAVVSSSASAYVVTYSGKAFNGRDHVWDIKCDSGVIPARITTITDIYQRVSYQAIINQKGVKFGSLDLAAKAECGE